MKKLLLLLLFVPIVSSGQSKKTKKVLKKIELKLRDFDVKQPISFKEIPNDKHNIVGEFENALFFQGFEVISNNVALDIVEFDNPLNQGNTNIKIQKYKEVKSVYVVDIKSTFLPSLGMCGGYLPITITASIIDLLNEGKLVGTFKFERKFGLNACVGNVAEGFAIKLKEASSN